MNGPFGGASRWPATARQSKTGFLVSGSHAPGGDNAPPQIQTALRRHMALVSRRLIGIGGIALVTAKLRMTGSGALELRNIT